MGFDGGVGFAGGGGGGGGGGGVSLTYTEVAFGSSLNAVTSSSDFIYDIADSIFSVGFDGNPLIHADDSSGILVTIGDVANAANNTSIQVNDSFNKVGNGTFLKIDDSAKLTTINTFSAFIGASDNIGSNLQASYQLGTITLPNTSTLLGSFNFSEDSAGNIGLAAACFDSGTPDTSASQLALYGADGVSKAIIQTGIIAGTPQTLLTVVDSSSKEGLCAMNSVAFALGFSVNGSGVTIADSTQISSFGDINGSHGGQLLYINNATKISVLGDFYNTNSQTKLQVNDARKVVVYTNAIASPTMQVYTNGTVTPNVTVSDGVRGLYYDPVSVVSAATITLPSSPVDGQEILISFGGQIASGQVVTSLSFSGTIIRAAVIASANAGNSVRYKYRASISSWYTI